MDLTERLALIIDANTGGAVTNVRKLAIEEQAAAEKAELLQAKIADLNTRMAKSATGGTATQRLQLQRLNTEYSGLTSTLAGVPKEASRAEKALAKVPGIGGLLPQGSLGVLGKAGPGLAVGAAAAAVYGEFKFLEKGVAGYTKLADQIRQVAQASGATAPQASELVAITNELGISSDQTALGMFRLARNIEQAPQKLAAYGISVARTKQGNADLVGTLDNVIAAYQRTQDPARRAALVFQAFGRAGATMLPILNADRKQLERIREAAKQRGEIFTSQDLAQARNYEIAMRELSDSWQALAIEAGKTLVPMLTTVARGLTDVANKANQAHLVDLIPLVGLAHLVRLVHHPSGTSAQGKAAAEVADAQQQAAQQAANQAAIATLAGAFDVLAGPQTLHQAKQTLHQAREALVNAREERKKALRDLTSAKAGGSRAGASEIEVANLRIAAAEERLRKAEYTGRGVDTAKASLLSAQDHLNRLRAQGGVDTNRLADAEDRLRRANFNLTEQQKKAHAAQRSVNQATGLSAKDVLARLTGQSRNQQRLANANVRLAGAGVDQGVIANLDSLEKQIPGTLVKVSRTINAGIVAQLNKQNTALDTAQSEFGAAASNPELFRKAGATAGTSFVRGFGDILNNALPPLLGPFPGLPVSNSGPVPSLGGLLNPQVNVNGPVTVVAPDPAAFGRKLRALSRQGKLSGPHHVGGI